MTQGASAEAAPTCWAIPIKALSSAASDQPKEAADEAETRTNSSTAAAQVPEEIHGQIELDGPPVHGQIQGKAITTAAIDNCKLVPDRDAFIQRTC